MRIECECVFDLDLVMHHKDTFMCNEMLQFARVNYAYRHDLLYAIIRTWDMSTTPYSTTIYTISLVRVVNGTSILYEEI